MAAKATRPGRNKPPVLLSKVQLAEVFGITPRTINRAIARGELPFYRLGNQTRFLAAEAIPILKRKRKLIFDLDAVLAGCRNRKSKQEVAA